MGRVCRRACSWRTWTKNWRPRCGGGWSAWWIRIGIACMCLRCARHAARRHGSWGKGAGRGGCAKSPDIVERKWVRAIFGGGNGSEEGERKALFYEVREKYTLCC